MREPKEKEVVICPISGEKIKPSICWDSVDPKGKKVSYGVIPGNHKHKTNINFFGNYIEEPCEWAGLPAPIPVEVT